MQLNHLVISGHLTRDPEIRTVGADRMVTAINIAQNRKWKTPEGEVREEPLFIDGEAWGRTGELIAQFLTKGSPVILEGRLKFDAWTDKETGGKRSRIKMHIELVHLLPRNQADGGDISGGENDPGEPGQTSAPQARPAARTAPASGPTPAARGRAAPASYDAPPF